MEVLVRGGGAGQMDGKDAIDNNGLAIIHRYILA